MDKIEVIEATNPDGSITEHVIIDRGNNEFTSYRLRQPIKVSTHRVTHKNCDQRIQTSTPTLKFTNTCHQRWFYQLRPAAKNIDQCLSQVILLKITTIFLHEALTACT